MNRLKKLLLILILSLTLVFSGPAAVLAGEAASAQEATSASEASTVQPTSSPSPTSGELTTSESTLSPSGAPEASSAQEAEQSSPAPFGYSQNNNDYEGDTNWSSGDQQDDEERRRERNGHDRSGNVGDTNITTGDAGAGATVTTTANKTTFSPGSLCSACIDDVSVKNSGNGEGSNNTSTVNVGSGSTVAIDNDADVDNYLNLDADTGDNTASYNVGDSAITTGDANVSGVVITSANETGLGVVEYNILDDHNGDIILAVPDGLFGCSTCSLSGNLDLQNTGNGADSASDIAVTIDNSSDTNINNNADVVNNLNLDANSGDNETSYNTAGDSNITTGDANVAANLVNFVNSTISGGVAFVVNIFGDLVGDIIFPDVLPGIGGTALSANNVTNGADSTNNIDINSNNEQNTTLNNLATIDNVISIDGTTGGNETKYNTGGNSSIETGDVFVNAEVINVINTNLLSASSEPLWLILVNNMGLWTGNIIGALTGTNYSAGGGLVFTLDENGEVVATNSGNGADSTNNITINENNSTNTTINNTANVTNNINIDANTGNNEANYNTGGDSTIKTGDVNVAASIFNFVNTNIIGRTLMLGIINVFGSWMGDAVPPGQDPNPEPASASLGGSSGGGSSSNGSSGGPSAGIAGVSIGGYPYPHILKPTGLSSLFTGSGGATGDDDNQGAVTVDNGGGGQVLGDSADGNSGIFSLTFNWKMLLFSLIPLLAFGIWRVQMLVLASRRETAVASEIKIKKKK